MNATKIISNIKLEITALKDIGVITAAKMAKAHAYVDRNEEEMVDMVNCQGCRVSEAADIAIDCSF